MPSFFQTLFPCFASDSEEEQSSAPAGQPPAKPTEKPRVVSNTSAYGAPIPVSENDQHPTHRHPNTDKKLPPNPAGHEVTALELPGSSPDLHEMAAPHHHNSSATATPLAARPSNATPTMTDARPSQQSERAPHSPYSQHSTLVAGSGSTYQPSVPPSDYDPDEISPAPTNSYADYPRAPHMYSNVTDALSDRKRMFERLRRANGGGGQQGYGHGHGYAKQRNGGGEQTFAATVTPVEMEAPVASRAPSEMTAREHVRNASAPKELE